MKTKITLLITLLSSMLSADFTLEYSMGANGKQLVEYKDAQHVKMTTTAQEGKSSQLISGDKKYMIMNQGGQTQYMDMDEMLQKMKGLSSAFGASSENISQEETLVPDYKIIKKGKPVTVAGINGETWKVEYDNEGKKEQTDVVVTSDKKVVEAVHHYVDAIKSFAQMDEGGQGGDIGSMFNIADGYVMIDVEGMKLLKFDTKEVSDTLFALPNGVAGKSVANQLGVGQISVGTKPPLCPITGNHGDAKELDVMLKASVDGWEKVESATCLEMMKIKAQSAIYKKGDDYIHMSIFINDEKDNGIVAKYRTNNLEIQALKQGKIQGQRYQTAYLVMAKQNAMDIKLQNAMLTMSTTSKDVDLVSFAKDILDLSKFVPVKKEKATAEDALKGLGGLFGGQGIGSQGNGDSSEEMKKAGEMLKGLFGH